MTLFPVVCISFALEVKLGLSLTCRVIVDVLPIAYGSDDTEYSGAGASRSVPDTFGSV